MFRTGLFREESLDLLSFNNDGLVLHGEALELVREIKGPLAIVTIAGLARSGKSYLLNRLLLNRMQGFAMKSNERQKAGLVIWGKPVLGQTIKHETISILVVDSNTNGLSEASKKTLSWLQTVLSSTLLYNCSWPLSSTAKGELGDLTHQKLPLDGFETKVNLTCIARDCKTGAPVVQELLQFIKEQQISEIFENPEVMMLARPVVQQTLLERLHEVDYQQLSPEFVEQLIQVRRRIISSISSKVVNGKIFDGASWVEMLRVCESEINSKKQLPRLALVWKRLCEAECGQAGAEALELYRHKYREFTLSKRPVSEETVRLAYKQAKMAAVEFVTKKCPNSQLLPSWISSVKKLLREELSQTLVLNSNDNFETTSEFLTFEYQTIERKLKTRQLKTVQDYRKEMLMFHEFYKRRGNNSVVGKDCYHEFVLKKLYDGVGIIVGYMNEDSEERVRVLAEAARRMESELKELRQSTYKDKSQVQSKLEKLAHQNNELLAKEQALEEAIEDLKLQKEAIEKSHLSEITRERSDYSRSVQDLRNRLAQCESRVEESERNKLLFESELLKKQILYSKSLENYENIIGQHKAALSRFAADKQASLSKAELERRSAEIKLESKIREYQQLAKESTTKLQEAEERVGSLQRQLLEVKEHNDIKVLETKETVQSLQTLKKELELECKVYEKKINQNKHKAERLNRQEEELRVLSEELQRLSDELKFEKAEKQKIKAILEQKQEFLELELKETRNRSQMLQERMRNTASSLSEQSSSLENRNHQLQEEVVELRRQSSQLKEELERKVNQLGSLKVRIEQKDQELLNYLRISKEREEALEASKSMLLEQMRNSDFERMRLAKMNDGRKNDEVERLKEEIQMLQETYKEELQELKNSSEESLRQLKNFHALEKERLECRLMEERSRNEKKNQTSETDILRRLREAGHRYQEDLLELKKQLWEDEKNYKSEINRLEYQLSEKKAELEHLRTKQPQASSSDENLLQIQILNHRIQDLTSDNNNRVSELKAMSTQKDKLEELLRIREETFKLAKETLQSDLNGSRLRLDELTKRYECQSKRVQELQKELNQYRQTSSTKQESLLTENRFLVDKIGTLTKQQEQSRFAHEQEVNRLKRQQAESLRTKLLEAERQLDSIQDKYEQARECILELEQAHTRELSKVEQDRRLLQSQLNAVGNTNNLLFRKLRTP